METSFVTADDGVRIEYHVHASTQPTSDVILFQHGFTSGAGVWDDVIPFFVSRYTCVTISCRGTDGSGCPTFKGAYSIERCAEDVVSIANKVHGRNKPFHYVGHSMGGQIGFHLALQESHKHRLKSLVLVAPAPGTGIRTAVPNYHEIQTGMREAAIGGDTKVQNALVDVTISGYPRGIARKRAEDITKRGLSVAPEHFHEMWRAMTSCRMDLTQISVPTLMIAGATDSLLSFNLRDFKLLRNVATLHVFSRVGHGLPREVPVQLSDVILDFLEHGPVTQRVLNRSSGDSRAKL
eukprot:TRINITY_DN1918_c0_g1_i1.p1 TRINITY_DN1918_c0_g1~~TRINITY_DN1918_c0_g1_i1.p1  ORF type:complete len:322 (-),score=20.83 TRINITY_DN1918_c0_g1_i1:474-1355(-)